MNKVKVQRVMGYVLWAVAIVLFLPAALVNAEGAPNLRPFLQFLLLCGFLVAGYVLIDAANAKLERDRRKREQHAH